MFDNKTIKLIGIVVSAIGIAVDVISNVVETKQMAEMVQEKVNKALAQREDEEE